MIGLFVLGAALVAVVVRLWPPNDRRLIEGQLGRLATAASVSGAETVVVQAAGAARVAAFFTDDVMISADDQSSTVGGRDAVMALAAQARAASRALRVAFNDVQIAVNGPSTATAYLTVTISGASPGGEKLVDAREVNLAFRKVGGTWLIARVDALRTLERAP
jgi:ketosteroid isomerase-like protein